MKRKVLQGSIHFRCSADLLSRIDAIADMANEHRSVLMRQALALLISRQRKRKHFAKITQPAV